MKNIRNIGISAVQDGCDHEIIIQMQTLSGIIRKHRFKYLDCDVMNAIFDDSECSLLTAKPKVFTQLVEHIYQSPEVLVETNSSVFMIRTYRKADTLAQWDGKRYMHTGLSIDIDEFDVYDYRSNGAELLIFCLKEVRNLTIMYR